LKVRDFLEYYFDLDCWVPRLQFRLQNVNLREADGYEQRSLTWCVRRPTGASNRTVDSRA